MSKLQKILRSNGSSVYSVNIPLEIIEQLSWRKGDDLSLEFNEVEEQSYITIFKKGGEQNVQEETSNAEVPSIQGSEQTVEIPSESKE